MSDIAAARRIAIVGARIADAATDLDQVGVCVVDDGVVSAVGPDVAVPAGARIIDGAGLALIPGIIDSHAHLPQRGERTPAHERLLRAGVTTAVDFANMRGVLDQWHRSAAGLSVLGLQAMPAFTEPPPTSRIRAEVESALDDGAIGIKIFGGHYPSDPATTADYIRAAHAAGAYVGFHAGTTEHGSDLEGMAEAIELADGLPFHLAHTNSYLRGAVDDPLRENLRALQLLREHPQVRSEASLAQLNGCSGRVVDGAPADHIARNCLSLRDYPPTVPGLERAFRDGYAHALVDTSEATTPVTGDPGLAAWRSAPDGGSLAFPVNVRLSGFLQTCARINAAGDLVFQGPGDFVVDAISSDGGRWRNTILDQGLTLVQFGALTLVEFVRKACWRPAQMFGLADRGTLAPGARADLTLVDLHRRAARTTIAGGRVVYDGSRVTGAGGEVLTTARGAARVAAMNIPHRVIDPGQSLLATPSR